MIHRSADIVIIAVHNKKRRDGTDFAVVPFFCERKTLFAYKIVICRSLFSAFVVRNQSVFGGKHGIAQRTEKRCLRRSEEGFYENYNC